MDRVFRLKPSCLYVKLPPVKWIHFTMHESHFLGMDGSWTAWAYTWKAILLASGVPHDDNTEPTRFLLSKHDDHALAALLRTTVAAKDLGKTNALIKCVTGNPIFWWAYIIEGDSEFIKIVYASQLSKEEAARFTVRGKPLEIIECELSKQKDIEHEVETETED